MAIIYEIQPNIFAKYVPKLVTVLPDGTRFSRGTPIMVQLPAPIEYLTGHSANEPPLGLHNPIVPLMSDELIDALRDAGVDNLQCFPANVKSRVDGTVWKNYQSVNIIGLVACADHNASSSTKIIDRPGAPDMPLQAFEKLRVDTSRARDFLMFRLAESPMVILVVQSVVEHLRKLRSDEEWGITLDARS